MPPQKEGEIDMITREAFVSALGSIKGPESQWHWEHREPQGVILDLNLYQVEHLVALLRLLRAAVPDPHDYVGRWLMEVLEPIPQKDGTTVTIPWDDPGALYDLLVQEAAEQIEKEEDTILEITLEPELERAFREWIAPTGFTLEQMAQMFLSWCTYYPEDASAWLRKSAEEQETASDGEGEKDAE